MPTRCVSCQRDVHEPIDATSALATGAGAPCAVCPRTLVVPQLGVPEWTIRDPITDLTRTSSAAMAVHLTATERFVAGQWHYGYGANGHEIRPIIVNNTQLVFRACEYDPELLGAWMQWEAFDRPTPERVLVRRVNAVRHRPVGGLLTQLLAGTVPHIDED